MANKSLYYFAYGSNLHPQRLRARVSSSRVLTRAKLRAYQLNFHKPGRDGSGKCNLRYTGNPHDIVEGAVFEMLASEQALLDKFEGVGINNERANVTVLTPLTQRECFLYIGEQDYIDETILPYSWYKAFVVQGARINRLASDYVARLENVAEMPDLDKVRHLTNMAILENNS